MEEKSTRIQLTVAAAEVAQRISFMQDIRMELLGLKPKAQNNMGLEVQERKSRTIEHTTESSCESLAQG